MGRNEPPNLLIPPGTSAVGRKNSSGVITPTKQSTNGMLLSPTIPAGAGGSSLNSPNDSPIHSRSATANSTSSSKLKISAPTNFKPVAHVDAEFNWYIPPGNDISSLLTIQETLGSGAFGTVFKVSLNSSGGFVMAGKQIKIADESIKREVDTLKRCKHDNLLQYYGCVIVGRETWVLTDYCGAGSCTDIMERTGTTFSEQQAAYVIGCATRGLGYLHSANVIHRDVKGANIMLTADGKVKLGDFGVSERITMSFTKRQTTVGSPYWMAPEVIKGERYDYLADVWSLGITSMELVDGVPPHAEIHPMRVLFKIPYADAPRPESGGRSYLRFIEKCLQKDADKRKPCAELVKEPFVVAGTLPAAVNATMTKVAESLRVRDARAAVEAKLVAANAANAAHGSHAQHEDRTIAAGRRDMGPASPTPKHGAAAATSAATVLVSRPGQSLAVGAGGTVQQTMISGTMLCHDGAGSDATFIAQDSGTMLVQPSAVATMLVLENDNTDLGATRARPLDARFRTLRMQLQTVREGDAAATWSAADVWTVASRAAGAARAAWRAAAAAAASPQGVAARQAAAVVARRAADAAVAWVRAHPFAAAGAAVVAAVALRW